MCNNILKHPSVDDYTKTKEFNVFFPNLNFDRLEAIDWKNKKITAAKETIKELLKEKGNVNNKTDDNDYVEKKSITIFLMEMNMLKRK